MLGVMNMPYIKEEDRMKYQHDLMSLNARLTVNDEIPEGELNFLIIFGPLEPEPQSATRLSKARSHYLQITLIWI